MRIIKKILIISRALACNILLGKFPKLHEYKPFLRISVSHNDGDTGI